MISSRCRPAVFATTTSTATATATANVPEASADKDKSPRLKRDAGGWVLVAVAGIVLFSGSIIAVLVRKYSGLLLLPPSFKRLPLDDAGAARLLREHRFVLLGGPHRGGTTLLWRLLAEHPLVSAFAENSDTDYGEGAFLQTLLPRFGIGEEALRQTRPGSKRVVSGCVDTAMYVPGPPYRTYGLRVPASGAPYVPRTVAPQASGIGRYAFSPESHLTEASRIHLHTNRSRRQLLSEWGYHWNLSP